MKKNELTYWPKLSDTLRDLKIIHDKFTGRIELEIRSGGISGVIKKETLK